MNGERGTGNGERGTGNENLYSGNYEIEDKGKEKGLGTSFEHALFQCDCQSKQQGR